jgi:microcystin-dependent protein
MSEPFLSEIKIMSFNFAPKGWALCNGQFLPINQNQALFALLGTTYGGNGQTTFALPNLQGRVPMHFNTHSLGESAGATNVTLTSSQVPAHTHLVSASQTDGDTPVPTNNVLAATPAKIYAPPTSNLTTLYPQEVSAVGGGQPHNNMMPYLTLSFCIALQGIFPSQN